MYIIYTSLEFEFDPEKSRLNKEKHGIDFNEVQELWNDTDYAEIDAKPGNEPRTMVIGQIKGKLWTVIVTLRANRIRIISARRSRSKEAAIYES
jgi:uncharacterized protein